MGEDGKDGGAAPRRVLQLPLPEVGEEGMRLRTRGRPAGALDRGKRHLKEYLAGLGYRDPAVVLAETFSRPIWELQEALNTDPDGIPVAKEQRISRAEVFALQLKAAAELLPYLHGKMPAVDVPPDERLPVLVIDTGTNQLDVDRGLLGGETETVMSVGVRPGGNEENQRLGGPGPDQSHGGEVARDPKPLT